MIVTTLGTLEEAAREAVGNWMSFGDFSWDRSSELEDADQFCLVYTQNRDSGLLDQSNAEAIADAMKPFLDHGDVMEEHHNHWACGWVDGYAIRVYRDGKITDAFRTYHDLQTRLSDYPVLDEDDYSNRVCEATLANIADSAWRLKKEYDLPSDWGFQTYRWLSDHDCSEIENDDDRGGYPSELWLQRAFDALRFKRTK
jgi:hypothetical protein